MADEIHIGDTTEFRIQVLDDGNIVDLSTADVINIIFRKPPDDEIFTVQAELYTDGTDGIIKYIAQDGDIDRAGIYKIQGYVEVGSGKYSTSIGQFRVHCNL